MVNEVSEILDHAPPTAADRGAVFAAIDGKRRWKKRARAFIAPALAALIAGLAMGQLAESRYFSEARLRMESRPGQENRNRLQMIASREFMRQILNDDNLAAQLVPPPAAQLAQIVGAPRMSALSQDEQALREVEQNLSVTAGREGQVDIGFVANDPRVAANVANAFAEGYLKLQKATSAFSMHTAGVPTTPARIIARAEPASTPLFPSRWLLVLGAAAAGGALAALVQSAARRRRGAADFAPALALPPPAACGSAQHLPWIGGEAADEDIEGKTAPRRRLSRDSELADLSRLVELRGQAARLVVVTGPSSDLGTAHCALALGRSLAGADRRAVIVCLDIASAALDGLTGDPRAAGLTDLLFGVASFSDAIHRETVSRCHVIPPGRGARESEGLVGAERLMLILSALEQTYDHVVVAAPPLGGIAGAERIAALRPTTILVTQPGAGATDAVHAFDELAAQGFSDIAMVTFAELPEGELAQAA